ncbi:MAG: AGE family epimerase/isomerase [Phycisphaerae bacterium]|nr:AGE family epimerase/isomerase [Phycisphaerae bacterium]
MLEDYLECYKTSLFDSVVPFWLQHSLDRDCGGTYSCLDRDGTVYDTKKYVWLVARSVWMFSRLYNECGRQSAHLDAARLGVEFLEKHALDEQGRYYFSLTREGRPCFFQRKPYSAVFAMLAYLEYARATGQDRYKHKSIDLFWKIAQWIEHPEMLGRPTLTGAPRTSGLANVMVLAGMALELAKVDKDGCYVGFMKKAIEGCRLHYDKGRRIMMEHVALDGSSLTDSPEGRFFIPGHAIEAAWFLLHVLDHVEDKDARTMAYDIIEGSLEYGWDKEYGGLYYFMDVENRPTLQLESSMKLWWPHTEALYALVLAYTKTEETRWLRWLDRVHDYTFKHFVDPEHGAWFGYCDRRGNLTHTCKGGNYKGFFHVPRALLFCIQAIESQPQV